MKLEQADKEVYQLLLDWDGFEQVCVKRGFIDYNLSDSLSDAFRKAAGLLSDDRLLTLRSNLEGSSPQDAQMTLLEGREHVYSRLHDIYTHVDIGRHPYGEMFKRKIRSYLSYLEHRIRPFPFAAGPWERFEAYSQYKFFSEQDVKNSEQMPVLEKAIQIATEKLYMLAVRRLREAVPDYRENRTENILNWFAEFMANDMYAIKINNDGDFSLIENDCFGRINNQLKHMLNIEKDKKWGHANFECDIKVQLLSEHPGFFGWLEGNGRKYKLDLNFVLVQDKGGDGNLRMLVSPTSVSRLTTACNNLHETAHMLAFQHQADMFMDGSLDQGGEILKSLALKTTIDTSPYFDEFLATACPFVWPIGQGTERADIEIAYWGKMLQRLVFARSIEKALRDEEDTIPYFEDDCKRHCIDVIGFRHVLNGMLNLQNKDVDPHTTQLYSRAIIESVLIIDSLGEEGLEEITAKLIRQYHDSHSFYDALENIGGELAAQQGKTYKPAFTPFTPPEPPTLKMIKEGKPSPLPLALQQS